MIKCLDKIHKYKCWSHGWKAVNRREIAAPFYGYTLLENNSGKKSPQGPKKLPYNRGWSKVVTWYRVSHMIQGFPKFVTWYWASHMIQGFLQFVTWSRVSHMILCVIDFLACSKLSYWLSHNTGCHKVVTW
jgi:hypothetical protein